MIATVCFLIAVVLFALAVFSVTAVFTLPTVPLGLLFFALAFVVEVMPYRGGRP